LKKKLITFTCIIFLLVSCSGCLFYGEKSGSEVKDFLENISDV